MRQPPARGLWRTCIVDRPAAVNDRHEPGHWEVDQIIGARNASSMIWLSERVTRFSIPVTMPLGYSADAVLVEAYEQIPAPICCVRSASTRDRVGRMADARRTDRLDCWFCESHSPWQRGQIENLNQQFRFRFPRGTDSEPSPRPTPSTPPELSTGNADADSTTKAPPTSIMPSPCSDRWTSRSQPVGHPQPFNRACSIHFASARPGQVPVVSVNI